MRVIKLFFPLIIDGKFQVIHKRMLTRDGPGLKYPNKGPRGPKKKKSEVSMNISTEVLKVGTT